MIVDVEDLSKNYGKTAALKGISFRVEGSGVIGLLGPNGAGKTTLFETLEGLRIPSSGNVSVLGMSPTRQARSLRELIGVQLQSTAVPPELTPLETLRVFGGFYRKSLEPMAVLERMGLADKARSRNATLSGGQSKRLAIAMALINDPQLIILDEPTAGLDAVARREIHGHISDLRASGNTVLLSTHSIDEAEKLCNRVIVLRAGKVVADGSPLELATRTNAVATLEFVLAGQFDPSPLLEAGAAAVGREGEQHRFHANEANAAILALGQILQNPGVRLVDLRMKRPNLEEVYLDLMDREDREGG
jgi:ABC-2 type transport system ATP-binding protein